MSGQPTCAERLPSYLESRIEDFRRMVGWRDAWAQANGPTASGHHDAAQERIDNYPLAISVKYQLKVELSWGGPADYLTATVDADGDIESIEYHFADWFDHAERSLSGSDFDAAKAYIEATIDLSNLAEYAKGDY